MAYNQFTDSPVHRFTLMTDCLFCKIAAKAIPGEIVYEDDHAFAILDIMPGGLGLAMVIPKVHAANILELPEGEVGPVFSAMKKMTARLQEVLAPDGFTIGINHGDVSGQTVKHLHVHILPRFEDDGGSSIHSIVNRPPKEALSDLAARLRTPSS